MRLSDLQIQTKSNEFYTPNTPYSNIAAPVSYILQQTAAMPQAVQTPKTEQLQIASTVSTTMDKFEQYPFIDLHNFPAILESSTNTAPNSNYTESSLYSNVCPTYDEQMRPYSAGSDGYSQANSDSDNSHISYTQAFAQVQIQPNKSQVLFDNFDFSNDSTNASPITGNSDGFSYNSSEMNSINDLDSFSIHNLIDELHMQYGADSTNTTNQGFSNNLYSMLGMGYGFD